MRTEQRRADIIGTLVVHLLLFIVTDQSIAQFSGGNGTIEDPYLVENIEQLQAIRLLPQGHFRQITDINASITRTWNDGSGFRPIGSSIFPFSGSYDGGGFVIDSLFINRPNESSGGIFGVTDSLALSNLSLTNIDITAWSIFATNIEKGSVQNLLVSGKVQGSNGLFVESRVDMTGITVHLDGIDSRSTIANKSYGKILECEISFNSNSSNSSGLVRENHGDIENCNISSSIITPANHNMTSGNSGVVGVNTGSISNVHAIVNIKGNGNDAGFVRENGGTITGSSVEYIIEMHNRSFGESIAGFVKGNGGLIEDCSSVGRITGGRTRIGGFVATNTGTIARSTAAGTIETGGFYVGGFVADNSTGGVIMDSRFSGTVQGGNRVGGFAGMNAPFVNQGITYEPLPIINNSSAEGTVVGVGTVSGLQSSLVGGFGGQNAGVIDNVYFTGEVTGNNVVGGVLGLADGVVSRVRSVVTVQSIGTSVGGFAGLIGGLSGTSGGEISKVVVNGLVQSTGSVVGGLAGRSSGNVSEIDLNIRVVGSNQVGGVVGIVETGTVSDVRLLSQVEGTESVGGVVGVLSPGSVLQNVISSSTVTASLDFGALIGQNGGQVSNVFWDTSLDEIPTNSVGLGPSVGIGLSESVLRGLNVDSSLDNLLSNENWTVYSGDYPRLLFNNAVFVPQSLLSIYSITVGENLEIEALIQNIGGVDGSFATEIFIDDVLTLVSDSISIQSLNQQLISLTISTDTLTQGVYNLIFRSATFEKKILLEVLSKPGLVRLVNPKFGEAWAPIQPVFTWQRAALATDYHLQVSKDSTFSELDLSEILKDTSYVHSTSLEHAQNYYWRVGGINELGYGEWSTINYFRTVPPIPAKVELLSPLDGARDTELFLTLSWVQVETDSIYHLQFSTMPDFSVNMVDTLGISEATFNLEQLAYGQSYFWRVRAVNYSGTGNWSSVFSVQTKFALEKPTIISPIEGASNTLIPVRFEWLPITGAIDYILQIATDTTFNQTVSLNNSKAPASVTSSWLISQLVSNLKESTHYFWRVKAVSGNGDSDWSEVHGFRTTGDHPIQHSPFNDAINVPIEAEFVWNRLDNFEFYELNLSRSAEFLDALVFKNISDTSFTVASRMLFDQEEYFWRVRAYRNTDFSAWSDVWAFKTELRVPEIPVWNPSNGSTNTSTSPLLVWGASARADSYDLQISESIDFQQVTIGVFDIEDTHYEVSGLNESTTYFWRVRAKNTRGTSNWSDVLNFTTLTTSTIGEFATPTEFELYQNYPNPFNPVTVFKYSLPISSEVSISVFNLTGQLLDLISMGQQSAGWHTFQYNGQNLSSGVYLYKITAGNYSKTGKMTLMK
jgi:hypothetical protein